MARLNIPPTKSRLMALQHNLKVASEGFELLNQKREILVMELMRMLARVRQAETRLRKVEAKAFATLRQAIAHNGYHRMRSVAGAVHYDNQIRTQNRVIAGVRIPEISIEYGQFKSQYGLTGTDSLVDQTMHDFLELLQAVGEMAQLETGVWLLARELKKTQRRVNALEQIFIPDFEETTTYIESVLEGKEQESFTIMKLVKKKIEQKRLQLE